MAVFTNNAVQIVNPNQPVILNTSIGCNKGYIYHRNESGIVTLRGVVNNPCSHFARYQVTFNGNIAVPTGGTAGPIAIAIAINGEPILTSRAIVTPTVVDAYFNVTSMTTIDVPSGCCSSVSVDCVAAANDGVTPAEAISVQNANMVVSRIA